METKNETRVVSKVNQPATLGVNIMRGKEVVRRVEFDDPRGAPVAEFNRQWSKYGLTAKCS